jgi:hypothetical protein
MEFLSIKKRKFSYKKLWKLLVNSDIKYKNLIDKTGVRRSTFYKLKKIKM